MPLSFAALVVVVGLGPVEDEEEEERYGALTMELEEGISGSSRDERPFFKGDKAESSEEEEIEPKMVVDEEGAGRGQISSVRTEVESRMTQALPPVTPVVEAASNAAELVTVVLAFEVESEDGFQTSMMDNNAIWSPPLELSSASGTGPSKVPAKT